MNIKINPYFEVILAAIIWGSSGAFIKYLNLPPTTISFFRLATPVLILGAIFTIQNRKIFKEKNRSMFLASLLNAIRVFLYFIGFTYTSIGNAIIILYTWPIFATIYSSFFLKEKISKINKILLFISFLGIIIIYSNKEISFDNKDFLGMSAVLISSIIYPLTIIIFKKVEKIYSKFEIIFYQNLIGAIMFLPFIFINQPFPEIKTSFIAIVYASLIGLVGFGLFFSALKKIKVSTASHLSYIEVISAILFGVFLFNETINWNIIIGGLFIISSTFFLKNKN